MSTPWIVEPQARRVLPALTEASRAFWSGGAEGKLMIDRCVDCRRWVHPPVDTCPVCGGGTEAEEASGRATVLTWTLNVRQFHPEIPAPNLIAVVVLDEQDDLRLATNLVACDEADLFGGMAVEAVFEAQGDLYYPLFKPVGR